MCPSVVLAHTRTTHGEANVESYIHGALHRCAYTSRAPRVTYSMGVTRAKKGRDGEGRLIEYISGIKWRKKERERENGETSEREQTPSWTAGMLQTSILLSSSSPRALCSSLPRLGPVCDYLSRRKYQPDDNFFFVSLVSSRAPFASMRAAKLDRARMIEILHLFPHEILIRTKLVASNCSSTKCRALFLSRSSD